MSVDTSRLEIREPSYTPLPEIASELSGTVLAPIIGPMGVGKTTVIQFITENYRDFGNAQGFTTRPPRPGETEYRYLPHTQEMIDELTDRVRGGELIQYFVHRQLKYVYGTEPRDYNKPYSLLALLPGALDAMRRLPTRQVVPISLIAEPKTVAARLLERKLNPKERRGRAQEGLKSLEWSLAQGEGITWVINREGELERTAEQVVAVVKGEGKGDSQALTMANELKGYFEQLTA